MNIVPVNVSKSYEVKIENGLLDHLGEELSSMASGSVMIVTETTVAPLYLERAVASLERAGFRVYTKILPAGEETKCAKYYLEVLDALAQNRLTRSDTLVALGGGVMGDLTGFAAATFLRGIRLVQVPTTLLSMVDSSVGGKTAIDLPVGKNLVGSFYQPSLVLCDPDLLSTLPVDIFRDGCAEVIKTAILFDAPMFDHLEANGLDFDRKTVITKCVEHKRDVVVADEYDRGERQLLNLGHTIGHAVEAHSHFGLSHGTCVAIGTAMMARQFASDADRIQNILTAFGLPIHTQYTADELMDSALSDKKRTGGTLTIVVPNCVGNCELRKIPVSELKSVIEKGM